MCPSHILLSGCLRPQHSHGEGEVGEKEGEVGEKEGEVGEKEGEVREREGKGW